MNKRIEIIIQFLLIYKLRYNQSIDGIILFNLFIITRKSHFLNCIEIKEHYMHFLSKFFSNFLKIFLKIFVYATRILEI